MIFTSLNSPLMVVAGAASLAGEAMQLYHSQPKKSGFGATFAKVVLMIVGCGLPLNLNKVMGDLVLVTVNGGLRPERVID